MSKLMFSPIGKFCSSLVFALLIAHKATAVPIAYTDQTAFLSALAGYDVTTIDFEAQPPGTVLPTGSTLNDLTITYDLGGLNLNVTDFYSGTSGSQTLGVDDAGDEVFFSGDGFDMSFASTVYGIGLYVIGTPGDVLADDFTLTTTNGDAVTNTSLSQLVLADGGEAFFLGIVDDAGFDGASLTSFGDPLDPFYFFNVDDIAYATDSSTDTTSSVPEPSTLFIFLAGVVALMRSRTALTRS